ncbi:hypothetical protein ACFX2B_044923 [Malus domestica]
MWLQEESCEETVSSAWSKPAVGLFLFQLYEKIQFTKCALLAWQKEVFGFAKAVIAKDTRDGIEDTEVGYFQNIFQSRGVLDHAVQEVVGACSPRKLVIIYIIRDGAGRVLSLLNLTLVRHMIG